MRDLLSPSRRGVALLLVLAALVVTVTALAALARLASTSALVSDVERRSEIAADLLRAADAVILDWLESESGRVLLPVDAPEPRVSVLDDQWRTVDDRLVRVRVTAWDQEGMASFSMLRGGSPVRLGLPSEVLRVVDDAVIEDVAGLDALNTPFPSPADEQPALGALVATHNPLPIELAGTLRTRRASPPRLNLGTAPVPLISSALRAEQRGGLEHIVQSRTRGEQPNISDVSGAPTAGRETGLILVNSSSTWSVRVDVAVGNVNRSWWSVFARSGSEWSMVQRLVIVD